jgi:hypothetical protein
MRTIGSTLSAFGLAILMVGYFQNPITPTSIRFPAGPMVLAGADSPEGAIIAGTGSIFLQSDGTIWRKATGTGTTGWVSLVSSSTGETSGQIAIFDTSCPSGWTHFSNLDGYFPYGSSAYGSTGGASSHDHTLSSGSAASAGSHDHTLNMTSYQFDPLGSGGTFIDIPDGMSTDGSHTHTLSGSTGSGSSMPPYREVVFCKKN